MAKHLSDYIFKKNFEAFSHRLCVRNETSNTIFTKSEVIKIKELKEDGVTLEIQNNVCQKGHNLTLFFLNSDTQGTQEKIVLPNSGHYKEALFEAIGKVEKLETNNVLENKEKMVLIDLHFTQYDQVAWRKILNLYEQNQDQINKMLTEQHKKRDIE